MIKEIKERIFALMHRRGGVYEICDNYHYQSLLTNDEESAIDYLEYLCENGQVNEDIVACCMRDEYEKLFLEGKAIPSEISSFLTSLRENLTKLPDGSRAVVQNYEMR